MPSKKLKILQVVHYFLPNHVAGTEVLTYNLSKEFKKNGHDVSIFCSQIDATKKNLSVEGGFYENLPVFKVNNLFYHIRHLLDHFFCEKIDKHFASYLDRHKPDVVHVHHLIALSWGMIAECKKRNIPVFFSMHDFWIMCLQSQRYAYDKSVCHEVDYRKCVPCMKKSFINRSSKLVAIYKYLFAKEKIIYSKDKEIFPLALNLLNAKRKGNANFIEVSGDRDNNFLMMHPYSRLTYKLRQFSKKDKLKFSLSILPTVIKKIHGEITFNIFLNNEQIFNKKMSAEELKKISDKEKFTIDVNKNCKAKLSLEVKCTSGSAYCNVGWKNFIIESTRSDQTSKKTSINIKQKLAIMAENYLDKMSKLNQNKYVKLIKKRETLIKAQLKNCEKVIAPTPFLFKEFKKWGAPNLLFSEDGIEKTLFEDFKKLRNLEEEIRFAFIGTLIPTKGVHVLIEAFNGIKDKSVFLNIYGAKNTDPEYLKKLEDLIENRNITFKGGFEKNKVAEVFKDFDVLIIPSIWYENAPLVIRNAILAKTPMICSDLPGMNFLVKHNENGFNFKPEDSKDLQKKIEKFIKEPSLIKTFSENMPKIKSIEENAREHAELYYKALKSKGLKPQIKKYPKLKKYKYKASIVIPTYNGEEFLEQVLKMINKQNTKHSYEVVLVDSGSTDSTLDIIKRHKKSNYSLYSIGKKDFNHGLTRNYGISKTEGEIVINLTQDAIPNNEHWLHNIVEVYNDPEVAAVYVKQIPRNDCSPIVAQRINQWIIGDNEVIENKINNFKEYSNLTPYEKYRLTNFDDVCSSIRRNFWVKNPYLKMNFAEDLKLGIDVITSGKKLVYTPHSQVIHSHNRTLFYEYKRTYETHKVLLELYNMVVIYNLKSYLKSVFYTTRADFLYFRKIGLSRPSKLYYLMYSVLNNAINCFAAFNAYRAFNNGTIKKYKI